VFGQKSGPALEGRPTVILQCGWFTISAAMNTNAATPTHIFWTKFKLLNDARQ
jgi:hypothetical protein